MDAARGWLEQLEARLEEEGGDDASVTLAYLAGREVHLDADELRAALRRAVLLLAVGGDPMRPLELDGRAVTAVADDLGAPAARSALAEGLRALRGTAAGLPRASSSLELLLAEPELAWQTFAAALLAEELAEEADG